MQTITTPIKFHNTDTGPRPRVFAGLVVLALGTAFLLRNFGLFTPPPLHLLWPLFIIGAGLSLLLRRAGHSALMTSDRADIAARFSNLRLRNESTRFGGGSIELGYSGLVLDLGSARMEGGEAVLDISARFSNVELRVPADWQVVVEMASTAGGVDNRTATPAQPTVRLVVRGRTVFANVLIRH